MNWTLKSSRFPASFVSPVRKPAQEAIALQLYCLSVWIRDGCFAIGSDVQYDVSTTTLLQFFAQSLRLPVLLFKVPQIVGRDGNFCRETFHSGWQINLYLHFKFSIFIRQNNAVIHYFK